VEQHVTRRGNGFRFTLFALIGGVVFIAGLALQVALVRYANIGADWAYAAQAFFSIELSYLLNRYVTWRDRSAGFWSAAWKFNAQKLLMTVINLTAYALLVRAGMEYIVANVVLTAIFTPVNYFAADLLVFVRGKRAHEPEQVVEPRLPKVLPTVSIVIPCKGSERTIRATVDSFLGQDYPALSEVILVGDVNDSTWEALADVQDSRLVVIEQERTPGRRDPNVKRDKGIRKSAGDVVALADSDVVADPGWLGRAVALLNGQGGGLVAGGLRSINDTFWGRFVDNNVMAAKTPRVPRPYRVTAQNFGARGCKPPITANAVFTRELYDSVQLDTSWAYGYEDYEWFWRLAREGHPILFASELTASHHHRRSFRQLVREYHQSAHGCAQFIRAHPESPLSKKRAAQAFGLPTLALGAVSLATLAAVAGHGTLVAGLLVMAAVLVTGREVARARSLEGLTYAPAALALGGVYAATIAGNLMRPAARRIEAPTWEGSAAAAGVATLDRPGPAAIATGRRRPGRRRVSWPLIGVLVLQAALSLRLIWSNTVFADEGLYLWSGHIEIAHWLHGLPMPANQKAFSAYFSGAPQIYGPIGALADSAWHLTGPRLLSLVFMLASTVLLFSVANRLLGGYAGICAAAIWAVSEPALKLGAFATFDPMAVFLMTAAVYVIVSPRHRRRHGELVALGGLLTGLASLTAYSYLIYVPVVAVIAVLVWVPMRGAKGAIISGLWMLGTSLVVFVGGATVLKVWPGIISEILARQPGNSGVFSVTVTSWSWVGITVSLALAGVVASVILKSQRTLLLAALAVSAVLVPLQNMRLQTGTALEKHIAVGLWLASIACGYLLSESAKRFGAEGTLKLALLGGFLLLIPGVSGFEQAYDTFHIWPNTQQFSTEFNALASKTSGPFLVEHPGVGLRSISEYSSPIGLDWSRWGDVSWNPPSVPASRWIDYYAAQLSAQKFGLVAIFLPWNSESPSVSRVYFTAKAQPELLRAITSDPSAPGLYALSSAVIDSHSYRLASVFSEGGRTPGTFVIWQRENPPTRVTPADYHVTGLGRLSAQGVTP
jgi:putative flippase GtrA/GT2 family glycosyltransferase